MKTKKIFPYLLLALSMATTTAMFNSCDDDKDNNSSKISNGNYKGIFHFYTMMGEQSGNVELKITGNRYFCSSNPNRIPAGGSGTFTTKGDSITFNDENIWTADFNWGLILNGTYYYSLEGKNLKIRYDKDSEVDAPIYEYDLIKQ